MRGPRKRLRELPLAWPNVAASRLVGVLGVLIAAALIGCAASSEDAALDKVTLTSNSWLSSAVEHIALDGGFFAEEGLDVEFIAWHRGGAALPALSEGDLDVAVTAPLNPRYFNVIQRGGRLRLVAARAVYDPYGCPYAAFIARPELLESGRLGDAASLLGLRLSGSRSGTTSYAWDRLLTSGGLTSSDVEMHYIPHEAKLDSFANNRVDVATASEPWTTRLLHSGHARVWRKLADVLPGRQSTYLLFGQRILDERRDLGRRFLRAYQKAARAYSTLGKTEQHLEIVARRTQLDRDELLEMCWPPWSEDGRIDPFTLQEYQEWALERGLIDAIVPFESLVDEWFLDQIDEPPSTSG